MTLPTCVHLKVSPTPSINKVKTMPPQIMRTIWLSRRGIRTLRCFRGPGWLAYRRFPGKVQCRSRRTRSHCLRLRGKNTMWGKYLVRVKLIRHSYATTRTRIAFFLIKEVSVVVSAAIHTPALPFPEFQTIPQPLKLNSSQVMKLMRQILNKLTYSLQSALCTILWRGMITNIK